MFKNGDDYYLSLGKFIHNFSATEAVFHYTFHFFAQIDPVVANVMKKESSSGAVASLIRALLLINDFNEGVVERTTNILDQFDHITAFRHRVIHRGAKLTEDGKYTATNWSTIKSHAALEIAKFDLKDIDNAAEDIGCMGLQLFDIVDGKDAASRDPRITERLYAPWRYKPVQLERPNSPPPAKKPVRPRQQKS